MMNNRERIIRTVIGESVDRPPFFFKLGFWEETLSRWAMEGVPVGMQNEGLGFDAGIRVITDPDFPKSSVNIGLCPWFKTEIYSESERKAIMRDRFGGTVESLKSNESLVHPLSFPITCTKDWESYKFRFNPEDPNRFPENFDALAQEWNTGDQLIAVGDYPYGLFGTCRELMGVEELLVSFYTQPELIQSMMNYLTDFWIQMYEKIADKVKIDAVIIWEDMSGQAGPLISPDFVRQFMLPNYQKIKAFCVQQNIPILAVDTDGDVRLLMSPFLEAGVNLLYPFETIEGFSTLDYRKSFPQMAMLGGIPKMELSRGKEAIDALFPKIKEAVLQGRYIPTPDHAIPPEVSYENYIYFVRELERLLKGMGKA